jgi:hypothetical protein
LNDRVLTGAGGLSLSFPARCGGNESIEKPLGGVNSIVVVVAFSFSVGTASVKNSAFLATVIGGLTSA